MFGYQQQQVNSNPPEELINCEPLDSLMGDPDNYPDNISNHNAAVM